jgi:hypothetical protein
LIIALVLLLFSSGSANYGRQQKEDDVMTYSADLLIDHIGVGSRVKVSQVIAAKVSQ